ncbi:delta1-piperideine-2-carboxylate reductase [Arthrobacter sp. V4I6]|uniref:Ldh family oxidoreductase n=1 Tax=unclassified Arthrobacter TaxID=235627 RepID=UPI00277F2787|nr:MULTISPECIES: Ldh family oxidoreductase [unclassified Arthrobacter]MDQ0819625.1 delta1-piperideine-2-carboxylate reductase [Arthrobacter sp. V1I7]MDQ0853806.1 delta1-piperideine-2-carboxylate reductase [Arthrobacter sp. V4I6]
MFVGLDAAREVGFNALRGLGLSEPEADVTVRHLLDCELRGLSFSGLARILSIGERLAAKPLGRDAIRITRQTPVSAQLDGGDRLGYVVAQQAVEIAIDKAAGIGLAVVGASNTWYTGMLSYYAEMITARGLVALIASNSTPWVAPFGGTEGRFGTNPFCLGFPSGSTPVVWDIGISEVIHAQAVLAQRLGHQLPPGVAYDANGQPTTDPAQALSGAFTAWGGHKGSGLGVSVQLLGMLAGSPVFPKPLEDFGFFVLAIQPDLLTPGDEFKAKVSEFSQTMRTTRRTDEEVPVRMPFERSAARRDAQRAAGGFDVDASVLEAVRTLAAQR